MATEEELRQVALALSESDADPATRVALCRRALAILNREDLPEMWARVQVELGTALLALPTDNPAEKIEESITALSQGLEVLHTEAEAHPLKIGRTISLLADAWKRRSHGKRRENLQRAISTYQMLFAILDPVAHQLQLADTERNLGDIYFEMSTSGSSESLELAITSYERALPFMPAAQFPGDVFAVRYTLAQAYLSRQGGIRFENVDRAITICQEGLEAISRDVLPRGWAGFHALLGAALLQRTHVDRAEDIQRAIAHLQMALDVATREAMPDQWATIMGNLGLAFSSRPILDPVRNQDAAIRAYGAAIQVHTRDRTPLEWAEHTSGLATAYMRLSVLGHTGFAQKAIDTYQEALSVLDPEDRPVQQGEIWANLGDAHFGRSDGDRKTNLERATNAYSQALETITRERNPSRWAQIQQHLGDTYVATGGVGEDQGRSIAQGIAAYENALAVQALIGMPREYRDTQRSLGDIFFERKEWAKATQAYSAALQATDLLYTATNTPQMRLVELGASRDLPARSAYCLAKLGSYVEAVRTLEDGRARALAEALSLADAARRSLSEADHRAFADAHARLLNAETKSREGPKTHVTLLSEMLKDVSQLPTTSRQFLDVSSALREARSDLEQTTEQVQRYDPDFMPTDWGIAEIAGTAALLAKPLVYLATTTHGTVAIIVLPGSSTFNSSQIVWLDTCTTAKLDQLLFSTKAGRRHLYSNAPETPIETLHAKLGALWKCLQNDLIDQIESGLAGLGHEQAVIVPMGLLGLTPLSAIAASTRISVGPSARALKNSFERRQATSDLPRRLFAVANPLPNPEPLPFARSEVVTILSHFPRETATVLHEEQATRDAVLQGMIGATHLHFACHGTFNIAEPLESALSLAGSDQLTLRDVLDASLDFADVRLVVLSACRTGIIDYQTVADEVVGFGAAFLQKGIPGIVTSLWSVPDFPTALLLDRFYALHADGIEPADALHSSQRWLRDLKPPDIVAHFERELSNPAEKRSVSVEQAAQICKDFRGMEPNEAIFEHPFYWASFTFSGC